MYEESKIAKLIIVEWKGVCQGLEGGGVGYGSKGTMLYKMNKSWKPAVTNNTVLYT